MSDLFVYGTLMDPDVWALVTGSAWAKAEAASIRGYKRVYAKGCTYPILRPLTGGLVGGMLIHRVPDLALQRLCDYEGPEYDLLNHRIVVAFGPTVAAQVFMPRPGVQDDGRVWHLDQWQRQHKRAFVQSLRVSGKPS